MGGELYGARRSGRHHEAEQAEGATRSIARNPAEEVNNFISVCAFSRAFLPNLLRLRSSSVALNSSPLLRHQTISTDSIGARLCLRFR